MKDALKVSKTEVFLALDVSTKATGYALSIADPGDKKLYVREFGVVSPMEQNIGNMPAIISDAPCQLDSILPIYYIERDEFKWNIIIESAFAGCNRKVYGQLSMMQGAFLYYLMNKLSFHEVQVDFVAPASWRKTLKCSTIGNEKNKKEFAKRRVVEVFGLIDKIYDDNVADALGILYHGLVAHKIINRRK